MIYFALANAPQGQGGREAASEQAQEGSVGNGPRTTREETSDGNTKAVTIRVTGSSGEPFGANIGNFDSSRVVDGVVPNDYEVRVRTDPRSGDYVSATVWKTTGSSKELKVQLVEDGRVVQENSTKKDYGATGVRWTPGDPPSVAPAAESTTNAPKAAGDGKSPQR